MSYEHVIWEQDGGVARVTFNRPRSLNAWTGPFGRELKQVIERDAADPAVRAVLVTGAGRGFSSGADLKEGCASSTTRSSSGCAASRNRSWPPSTGRRWA